ncbi:hypothetical protein D1872_149430 [compost metagenome]
MQTDRNPLRARPDTFHSAILRRNSPRLQNAGDSRDSLACSARGMSSYTTSHPDAVRIPLSASEKARQSPATGVSQAHIRFYFRCRFPIYSLYRAGIAIPLVSSIPGACRTTSTLYKYVILLLPVTDNFYKFYL